MRIKTATTGAQHLSPEKTKKNIPKEIWLTSLSHFSNDFYNGFLAPLLPILVVRLDISLVLAGSLVSISSIFNSLLQPVTGMIADRLSRNYFIVFASLCTGLFMSLIGVVNQYYQIAIILALSGLGTSLFHPQAAAFVGRIAKDRPGLSMSIFSMGGGFGIAIGALIVVPLVSAWGLKATLFTGLLAVVVTFFTFPLLKTSLNNTQKNKINPFRDLKGYRMGIFILFAMVVIRATMTILFQSFMPLYLVSQGYSTFVGSIAVAVFGICGTLGILSGGYYSDRMKPATLLKISFAFTLPFGIAFIQLPAIIGLPFFGLAAFFLFSSTPVNIILGQRLLPGNTSFISGIMMGFAWGIGGLMATPFGALADHLGFYYSLHIIVFLSIPGMLLAQLSPDTVKKR